MRVRRGGSRWRRAALMVLAGSLLGCHPRPAGEVASARAALAAAWAACAPEYAGARFDAARTLVDSLQLEGARGACGDCQRAIVLARGAERTAQERIAGARAAAEVAISEAEGALAKAGSAGRGGPPSNAMAAAVARLDEARRVASGGHCNYLRARELATEAKRLANHADSRSVASLRR